MFASTLLVFALSVFGSATCDGIDSTTGLGECESRDIERAIEIRRKALPNNKTEAEKQYASVCLECFSRHLACGKRNPLDVKFVCIVETESDLDIGSDAMEEAK
jgi:hypothetical protein